MNGGGEKRVEERWEVVSEFASTVLALWFRGRPPTLAPLPSSLPLCPLLEVRGESSAAAPKVAAHARANHARTSTRTLRCMLPAKPSPLSVLEL